MLMGPRAFVLAVALSTVLPTLAYVQHPVAQVQRNTHEVHHTIMPTPSAQLTGEPSSEGSMDTISLAVLSCGIGAIWRGSVLLATVWLRIVSGFGSFPA